MESTHKKSKDDEGNSVNKGANNDDVGGVENSPSAVTVNTDSDPFDEGNSPSAVKVNTDSDPFDEGNSPSAVKVNTDSDQSDEGETSGDSSDSSLGFMDYITDPRYSSDEIPFSASQPLWVRERGFLYTSRADEEAQS